MQQAQLHVPSPSRFTVIFNQNIVLSARRIGSSATSIRILGSTGTDDWLLDPSCDSIKLAIATKCVLSDAVSSKPVATLVPSKVGNMTGLRLPS